MEFAKSTSPRVYQSTAFSHCAFSYVASNDFSKRTHSRICCTCFAFLHCAFSYVASNDFYKRMHSRICCIYFTFLHCAFLYMATNVFYFLEKKQNPSAVNHTAEVAAVPVAPHCDQCDYKAASRRGLMTHNRMKHVYIKFEDISN